METLRDSVAAWILGGLAKIRVPVLGLPRIGMIVFGGSASGSSSFWKLPLGNVIIS